MKSCVLICLLIFKFIFLTADAQPDAADGDQYLQNLLTKDILFDTTGHQATTSSLDSVNAWKQWRTVENYYYGKNRGALPMIADLKALHPYFRDKVISLISACEAAGIKLAVVESYRTRSKQAEYYAMGRKYTSTPGGKSRHQYGLAVDVVPLVDSVAVWDNQKLWRKIGVIGERLGLTWGGRWRVLYDPGHFEWQGSVSRHDLAKGRLPKLPVAVLERYTALEEQLEMLQVYWGAWEVEQSVTANGRKPKQIKSEVAPVEPYRPKAQIQSFLPR